MLSRLVITFLPRSKRLLISWLQSPSAVIMEPQKIKIIICPLTLLNICYKEALPVLCHSLRILNIAKETEQQNMHGLATKCNKGLVLPF